MPRQSSGGPVSQRTTQLVPELSIQVNLALEQARKLPQEQFEVFYPILQTLRDAFVQQDRFNRLVWAQRNSLPAKHGQTHIGGSDNIVSPALPSPLTLGTPGASGVPQAGVAAIGHVHDTTALAPLIGLITVGANFVQIQIVDKDGQVVSTFIDRKHDEAVLRELGLIRRILAIHLGVFVPVPDDTEGMRQNDAGGL